LRIKTFIADKLKFEIERDRVYLPKPQYILSRIKTFIADKQITTGGQKGIYPSNAGHPLLQSILHRTILHTQHKKCKQNRKKRKERREKQNQKTKK